MFLILVVPFIIIAILIYFEIKMARNFYKTLNSLKGISPEEKKVMLEDTQLIVQKSVTNHKLHLLLSVLSAGLWAVAWLYINYLNTLKRKNSTRLIEEIQNSY